MRGRGPRTETLRKWARKAMELAKQYGPGIAKKYSLGSRALDYASKSAPNYSQYIDPVSNYVRQQGYGRRSNLRAPRYLVEVNRSGGALRSAGRGGALRSAGRGRYMRLSKAVRDRTDAVRYPSMR